jgi:hypothetical protein
MKTTSSNWHEHLQAERGGPQNKTEQVEINQVVDRFERKRFSGRGYCGGREDIREEDIPVEEMEEILVEDLQEEDL